MPGGFPCHNGHRRAIGGGLHGERITKSDDEVLRYGLHKMLDQSWTPSKFNELFVAALARLAPPHGPDN